MGHIDEVVKVEQRSNRKWQPRQWMKEPGHFFIKKKKIQKAKKTGGQKRTGYREVILRVLVQVLRKAAPGWEEAPRFL